MWYPEGIRPKCSIPGMISYQRICPILNPNVAMSDIPYTEMGKGPIGPRSFKGDPNPAGALKNNIPGK